MIDTMKLRGKIVEKGLTHADVAKNLGITPKTFSEKMRRGVFLSNEIERMIVLLSIDDPVSIFFAQTVTQQVTK